MTFDSKNLERDLMALSPKRAKANRYDDEIRAHKDAIKKKMDEGVTMAQIHEVFAKQGMQLSLKTFTKKIREIVVNAR